MRVERELPARREPGALSCLHCQLMGRRNMLCSRRDQCKDLPLAFGLGPLLLLGWAATVVAFILAVR